jgi:hypothetical protein
MVARGHKVRRIVAAIDGVPGEDAAEEEDLGGIPSSAAVYCCWASLKWWATSSSKASIASINSSTCANGKLALVVAVGIRGLGDDGRLGKVENVGGGEGVVHSRPVARQGFSPAALP